MHDIRKRLLTILILAAAASAQAKTSGARGPGPGDAAAARQDIAQNLIEQGVASFDRRRYSAAISMLRKAAELDQNPKAFFFLGRSYYFRGFQRGGVEKADRLDAGSAVKAFETARKLDPSLASIAAPYLFFFESAMCYQALRRYEQALTALRQAMRVAPNNPMPAVYAAAIYAVNHDEARSSEALTAGLHRARRIHAYPSLAKGLRRDPSFSNLLAIEKNQALIEAFDQADQGTITEAQAISVGRGSTRDGNRAVPAGKEKAVAARHALGAEGGEYEISRVAGRAGEIYRDSLGIRPSLMKSDMAPVKDPKILALIKRADKDLRCQDYPDAIARFQAALDADREKGTIDPVQRSMILGKIANSYRQMGLTGEAIKTLEQSAQAMPLNPFAHYQLALAYCVSGQIGRSLNSLDLALHSAPNAGDLRKILLLAKTDPELTPVRDLPAFRKLMAPYAKRSRGA